MEVILEGIKDLEMRGIYPRFVMCGTRLYRQLLISIKESSIFPVPIAQQERSTDKIQHLRPMIFGLAILHDPGAPDGHFYLYEKRPTVLPDPPFNPDPFVPDDSA